MAVVESTHYATVAEIDAALHTAEERAGITGLDDIGEAIADDDEFALVNTSAEAPAPGVVKSAFTRLWTWTASQSLMVSLAKLFQGAELTPVDGVLTIPLDGKTYYCTPTADITSIVLSGTPTAPATNGTIVYFIYATAARSIAHPADWKWPDRIDTLTTTKANFDIELTLFALPHGGIRASTTDIGVPA
jgi:hypothetical protein